MLCGYFRFVREKSLQKYDTVCAVPACLSFLYVLCPATSRYKIIFYIIIGIFMNSLRSGYCNVMHIYTVADIK